MPRANRRFWTVFWATFLFVTVLHEHSAKADVSSWMFVGGGVTQVGKFSEDNFKKPTFRLATGMGTDPSKPFSVGGLFRLDTLLGKGTDLSLALRLADYGFVNGNWGVAVDLGGLSRFWGTNVYGGTATIIGGGPWGLELELGGLLGTHDTQGFSAILGIDLARLTVYRQSGKSWWKNTFPAVRPDSSNRSE